MNKIIFQEYKNNGSLESGKRIEINWEGNGKGIYTGKIISSDGGCISLDYLTGVGNFHHSHILTIAPPVKKDGFKRKNL